MLSVKQGSCEYQFKSYWLDPSRNQTQVYNYRGEHSYHSAIWAVKLAGQNLQDEGVSIELVALVQLTGPQEYFRY